MHFRLLLADPRGDIEPAPETLARPFLLSPTEQHPFLKLADYFAAIRQLLELDDGRALCTALTVACRRPVEPADIAGVSIKSEKHGAFYHIASLTVSGRAGPFTLALTTALSDSAKTCLAREYDLVGDLAARFTPEFLPRFSSINRVVYQSAAGPAEFLMVIGEWLDGFHEWHLGRDSATGNENLQLWDYQHGFSFLTTGESRDLVRQAAAILTSYYDQDSFCQIYPWHHAAGDFVAHRRDGAVDVRLITVRNHVALLDLAPDEATGRLVAIINFLLNLTLRMRLDRLDGVGAPAWLAAFSVQASVDGFFGTLAGDAGRPGSIDPAELLEVLQAFDPQEYLAMYQPLLEIYSQEDADDYALLLGELPDHVNELHRVIQGMRVRGEE